MKIHLFWGQKVKGQGHEAQKQCRRWFWTRVSADFIILFIFIVVISYLFIIIFCFYVL